LLDQQLTRKADYMFQQTWPSICTDAACKLGGCQPTAAAEQQCSFLWTALTSSFNHGLLDTYVSEGTYPAANLVNLGHVGLTAAAELSTAVPCWRNVHCPALFCLQELLDALAYIDPLTPDVKQQVDKLIEEEMRRSTRRPADYVKELPPVPPARFGGHSMLQQEYER
jgi:hypothetical protein